MREAKRIRLKASLEFWNSSLEKMREAYLALLDGGVQKFRIQDRELTKFDIPSLLDEIMAAEQKIEELEAALAGLGKRKMVGILPRDW